MIICIGAFDGYHRGHVALFEKARSLAERMGTEWRLLTFEPHPRFVLGGLSARLFSDQEKGFLRKVCDIPVPIEIHFTKEFAGTEPGVFLDEVCDRLPVTGIVVGEEFRFGRGRSGDRTFLRQYCSQNDMRLELVPQLLYDSAPISSSRVREAVCRGELPLAAELLGYPYFMCAPVINGEKRGRTLGYPTANLSCASEKLLPDEGVYAGAAWLGNWVPAAVSLGSNPTFFEDGKVRIEAHLLGFSGDLYGKKLFLALLRRMRPMRKFYGTDALKDQLRQDCLFVQKIFSAEKIRLSIFERGLVE